ncbi:MAG TPA: pyridoxal-phosphate dependent enzyme [Candidatus Binatia bacterium]|jgi:D-cysteine desulfhydrase
MTATARTDVAPATALERRFPGLAGRLPRVHLVDAPTPLQPLRALGRELGTDLWIKRDDLTGAPYGGNKPRKLEFVLGAARRDGRKSVLTFGGIGTHHGLATTIAARGLGMRSLLVLVPQPVTDAVRHALLLDHAYGAELHFAASTPRAALIASALLARETLAGRRPLLIPPGGSSVSGTLGYVDAGLELAEQIAAGAAPEPEAVFVALGTGGTAAGLLLAFALAELRTRVVAVLVNDITPPSHARVMALARRAARHLHDLDPAVPRGPALASDRLAVVTDQLGAGYGAASVAGEDARQRLAALEGVALDSTYTAKCLAAVIADAAHAEQRGRTLLFWHTYSAVDPAVHLATLPDPRQLPRAFHRFFASD